MGGEAVLAILENRSRFMRAILALLVVGTIVASMACASRPIHVLSGKPSVAYNTLGMVSGQGENEASAISATVVEAAKLEADAIIVVSRRPVGRVMIVTARAIRYLAPPPEE
jgi:hypothetical protein